MARRDLEVIVIGAGMGGLAAAQKLEQYGFTPKILENAAEVGGSRRVSTKRARSCRPKRPRRSS